MKCPSKIQFVLNSLQTLPTLEFLGHHLKYLCYSKFIIIANPQCLKITLKVSFYNIASEVIFISKALTQQKGVKFCPNNKG